MEEKIITLDEADLDGIVGGALNQGAIDKHNLHVITTPKGIQLLDAKVSYGSGSDRFSASGPMSERLLKSRVDKPNLSVSIKTNTGDWKTLSPTEFKSLFS